MFVFFYVNNESIGQCHSWEGNPLNAHLSEAQQYAVPGTVLIGSEERLVDLSKLGFKKGDSIELEFDDKWVLVSARRPGETTFIWRKDQATSPANSQTTATTNTPLRTYGARAPHQIVNLDLQLRIDVSSIFIGIQRAELTRVDWNEASRTGREVTLLCLMYGIQHLTGRVMQIIQLRDGKIIIMRPSYNSLLKTWPSVWIWVSLNGSGGVLNLAGSLHHKYTALMQALRGTWISAGQALDSGWLTR